MLAFLSTVSWGVVPGFGSFGSLVPISATAAKKVGNKDIARRAAWGRTGFEGGFLNRVDDSVPGAAAMVAEVGDN